ncbi:serine hydrolase domain-containing protein, partial [Salinibacter altiplanensis]|uniref:serine hydrolase domain-containing protein n=1 Tax=Salinibacter altiplanensis TaxID=1803181 RepID=UPI000C9EEBC2
MRTVLKTIAVLGIAVFLPSPSPVWGQSTPTVDSVGRALADHLPGGVVIGLLHDDRTSVHSFGAADSTGSAPTARTLFEIGSVTKTFTGLLLADAIARSPVDPSTPVAALLPDSVALAPSDSTTMTLKHLATHRSGLPRLPANLNPAVRPGDPYAAYDAQALHAFLDGYVPPRPPGVQYEYSNLGVGLLGHLLARRADTTYAALVRQRITGPLGLSDTRAALSKEQRRRFAQGHNRAGAPTSPWHFEALAGAGALRSSAADMLVYLRTHRCALRADPDSTSILARAMRRA